MTHVCAFVPLSIPILMHIGAKSSSWAETANSPHPPLTSAHIQARLRPTLALDSGPNWSWARIRISLGLRFTPGQPSIPPTILELVCMNMQQRAHTRAYICACVCTCGTLPMCAQVHAQHVCAHVSMHAHMCTHMHTFMHMCSGAASGQHSASSIRDHGGSMPRQVPTRHRCRRRPTAV